MYPNDRVNFDKSQFGDAIYRDAYFRGLSLTGQGNVSQNAWCLDMQGSVHHTTCVVSSYDQVTEMGNWCLHVKVPGSDINPSVDIPQIFSNGLETRLSSDLIVLQGSLMVDGYTTFNDAVDISSGNVFIGKDLVVGGNIYLNTALKLSVVAENSLRLDTELLNLQGSLEVEQYTLFHKDVDIPSGNVIIGRDISVGGHVAVGNMTSPTVLSLDAISFCEKWRIQYNQNLEALVFQERVDGSYIDRLPMTNELIEALNLLVPV